jgi:hypothetical protein
MKVVERALLLLYYLCTIGVCKTFKYNYDTHFYEVPVERRVPRSRSSDSSQEQDDSVKFLSSTAVPKSLLALLRDPERYNKHALPTQDTGNPLTFNTPFQLHF